MFRDMTEFLTDRMKPDQVFSGLQAIVPQQNADV